MRKNVRFPVLRMPERPMGYEGKNKKLKNRTRARGTSRACVTGRERVCTRARCVWVITSSDGRGRADTNTTTTTTDGARLKTNGRRTAGAAGRRNSERRRRSSGNWNRPLGGGRVVIRRKRAGKSSARLPAVGGARTTTATADAVRTVESSRPRRKPRISCSSTVRSTRAHSECWFLSTVKRLMRAAWRPTPPPRSFLNTPNDGRSYRTTIILYYSRRLTGRRARPHCVTQLCGAAISTTWQFTRISKHFYLTEWGDA